MTPRLPIDMPEPEWLGLLKAERAKGRPVSEIARDCGMARPSVSMLLAGTYPARSLDLVERKHGAAIVKALRDRVLCPHLRRGIPAEECRAHAAAPMSISNVARMRQWEACRRCPLNPFTEPEGGKG
jgi:hypothetical protein